METYDPYIKIGGGTSKFYINLCKSYLKNYNSIYVIGGGYKINIALWVFFGLSKEYKVEHLQHVGVLYNRMHSMCMFRVSNDVPLQLEYFKENSKQCEFRIGAKTSISDLTNRCIEQLYLQNKLTLVAFGQTCVKAFFVASQLNKMGYFSNVEGLQQLENNKFAIKISVYKLT